MNCIIVDDEPLGRKAIQLLISDTPVLSLCGSFGDAVSAGKFMQVSPVDLVFLDIKMPGVNGLEFARMIPADTLVIFVTAYAEYALDSYEVDAIDYLVKPIEIERFRRAVIKAHTYHTLLKADHSRNSIESVTADHIFVKAERRYFKIQFKNILFIEGLKDYVVIQTSDQRIVTKMNLKSIHEMLPKDTFLRTNKSYIVNSDYIDSFDNNDIFIGKYEISIGNSYRDAFFETFSMKNNPKD
ncbi:MAG: LytTR family DNA-binding domain-containing protein [Parabacteroides sp.]|nr:LytTR family DNA-binding domain-containing protein [Parabacteroides sp.]